MILRIWAAGYIGQEARKDIHVIQFVIVNGPYRCFKHPLYLGNFFIVLGVIFFFNPPMWLAILLMCLFTLEYSIIAFNELNYLRDLPKRRVKFKFSSARGEISTVLILIITYLLFLAKLTLP
jgi:protein-S-isoprenylcysteine O-methyltransferase Ste14